MEIAELAPTIEFDGVQFKTVHASWKLNDKNRFNLDINHPVVLAHTEARLIHESVYRIEKDIPIGE